MHKSNNRGFSLVEVIVVVAILGALVLTLSGSFSAVKSANAKSCASEIDSMLSKCKVNAMSRAYNVYLEIYMTEDGVCVAYCESEVSSSGGFTEITREESIVGKKSLSVSYVVNGAETALSVSAGNKLYLAFDRTTGAMLTVKIAASYAGALIENNYYCTAIYVYGGPAVKTVELIPQTGKHEVV